MSSFSVDVNNIVFQIDIANNDAISVDIGDTPINIDVVEETINVDYIDNTITVDIGNSESIDVALSEVSFDTSIESTSIDVSIAPFPYVPPIQIQNGLVEKYECDLNTLAVGDLVSSAGVNNRVEKVVNNNSLYPVIGIVQQILQGDMVLVLMQGVLNSTDALEVGKKIFVSPLGGITPEPPTTGYLQCIGWASEDHKIWFSPNFMRVRRRQ